MNTFKLKFLLSIIFSLILINNCASTDGGGGGIVGNYQTSDDPARQCIDIHDLGR